MVWTIVGRECWSRGANFILYGDFESWDVCVSSWIKPLEIPLDGLRPNGHARLPLPPP